MLRPKPVEQCRPCTRLPKRSLSVSVGARGSRSLRSAERGVLVVPFARTAAMHSLWRALGFGMISLRSCASSLDYRAYTDTPFIHSGHFYSAPSSPLLLRGAPDYSTDTASEFHAETHRQLQVKDLPKVPTWRLERESNPRPSG